MIGETLPDVEEHSTLLEELVQNYEKNLVKVLCTISELEDITVIFAGQEDTKQCNDERFSIEKSKRVTSYLYDKIDDLNMSLSAIDYRLNNIIKKL